jgi:hypothetical protein
MTGPNRGPRAHEDMAAPRFSLDIISANDAAPIVSGQDPASPARKRNAMRPPRLGAKAQATLKMIKRTLQMWYNGSRPYISDSGAIASGPKQ